VVQLHGQDPGLPAEVVFGLLPRVAVRVVQVPAQELRPADGWAGAVDGLLPHLVAYAGGESCRVAHAGQVEQPHRATGTVGRLARLESEQLDALQEPGGGPEP